MTQGSVATRPWLTLGLVVASTVLGLMGTDLVLPAVPTLPEALGGGTAEAQMVLAAYAAGTGVGLLLYGALGSRFGTRALFLVSLFATAAISFACGAIQDIAALIVLRALQGAVAAGPAVFAPGVIRVLFDPTRAVRALGMLASIESAAPALAPILGFWLLSLGGWRLSFEMLGAIALVLAVAVWALGNLPQTARRAEGSYGRLMGDGVFMRYALSQAFVLGGLLTFVFGMPAVFVHALGGTIGDFIVMQVSGIISFVLAANLAARATMRFGAEPMIALGTGIAALGAGAMVGYAAIGGMNAFVISALFVPVNAGLGVRGPPGFFRAVVAAKGDDARGAALVILAVLIVAAFGTALAAPFIERGLTPLSGIAFVLQLAACACLTMLPRLKEAGS